MHQDCCCSMFSEYVRLFSLNLPAALETCSMFIATNSVNLSSVSAAGIQKGLILTICPLFCQMSSSLRWPYSQCSSERWGDAVANLGLLLLQIWSWERFFLCLIWILFHLFDLFALFHVFNLFNIFDSLHSFEKTSCSTVVPRTHCSKQYGGYTSSSEKDLGKQKRENRFDINPMILMWRSFLEPGSPGAKHIYLNAW